MNELFNLEFDRLSVWVFFLVPALINLSIFIYTCFFLPQNKTNYAFSVFVLLLGAWQATDGLVRMGATEGAAVEWYRISGMLSLFIVPFGIFFTLNLAYREKSLPRRMLLFSLLLPPSVFAAFISAGLDEYTLVRSDEWYWVVNPEVNAYSLWIYAWICIAGLTLPGLQWYFYFRSRRGSVHRKQFLLLASSFTVSVVIGIIAEVLFPLFLGKNDLPVTTAMLTCFSVSSLIAIKKYQMLQFSPRNQWANIVESMKEGILIVDNSDRIMYANSVFCEQMGYEFGELIGERADELFLEGDEQKEFMKRTVKERRAGRSSSYEVKLRTKQGGFIWMETSGTPYFDDEGKVIGSIGIHTNISRIKLAIQRFNEVQAIACMGSWELDFSTGTALWSDEACRIYGLSSEENVQSFQDWISFIHPEDMELVTVEIARAQALLSDSLMVHRIVRKDGAIRFVHSISKFALDTQGKPTGLYGIVHDVTETKLLEENLKATNKDLETFIYKSSHDLRGPLSSILGLVSIADMEVKDQSALQHIEAIGELAKKLDDLLMKLVRVMAIKDRSRGTTSIDMSKTLNGVLDSLKYKEGFKQIKFIIENNLTEPIKTDPEAMFSILLNLVENAIKYHDYSKPDPQVKIHIHRNKEPFLVIEVEDNGRGIPAIAKEKVFDMFYRASSDSKGSGLGLYIVKSNLKKLGGDIELRSEEGKGTVFSIKMPMAV